MKITIKCTHRDQEHTYTVDNPKRSFGIICRNWDKYPDFYEYLLVDDINIDHGDIAALLMVMGIQL